MLSYTKDMEMGKAGHEVLYKYKIKQWSRKNNA